MFLALVVGHGEFHPALKELVVGFIGFAAFFSLTFQAIATECIVKWSGLIPVKPQKMELQA